MPRTIREVAEGFIALLFPERCPGCGQSIVKASSPICCLCAQRLEQAIRKDIRRSICKIPQACDAFEHTFALWLFDKAGTVQRIHQGLKYNNRPYHGVWLGRQIASKLLLPLSPLDRPSLIIPIPLHRRRYLERGYNQSQLLAQGISDTTGIPLTSSLLKRTRYTMTQTGLDQKQRLENVQHAFSVPDVVSLKGKHLLLVDDVLTTGATLYAASLPLKKAGAELISIATLAMARMQ